MTHIDPNTGKRITRQKVKQGIHYNHQPPRKLRRTTLQRISEKNEVVVEQPSDTTTSFRIDLTGDAIAGINDTVLLAGLFDQYTKWEEQYISGNDGIVPSAIRMSKRVNDVLYALGALQELVDHGNDVINGYVIHEIQIGIAYIGLFPTNSVVYLDPNDILSRAWLDEHDPLTWLVNPPQFNISSRVPVVVLADDIIDTGALVKNVAPLLLAGAAVAAFPELLPAEIAGFLPAGIGVNSLLPTTIATGIVDSEVIEVPHIAGLLAAPPSVELLIGTAPDGAIQFGSLSSNSTDTPTTPTASYIDYKVVDNGNVVGVHRRIWIPESTPVDNTPIENPPPPPYTYAPIKCCDGTVVISDPPTYSDPPTGGIHSPTPPSKPFTPIGQPIPYSPPPITETCTATPKVILLDNGIDVGIGNIGLTLVNALFPPASISNDLHTAVADILSENGVTLGTCDRVLSLTMGVVSSAIINQAGIGVIYPEIKKGDNTIHQFSYDKQITPPATTYNYIEFLGSAQDIQTDSGNYDNWGFLYKELQYANDSIEHGMKLVLYCVKYLLSQPNDQITSLLKDTWTDGTYVYAWGTNHWFYCITDTLHEYISLPYSGVYDNRYGWVTQCDTHVTVTSLSVSFDIEITSDYTYQQECTLALIVYNNGIQVNTPVGVNIGKKIGRTRITMSATDISLPVGAIISLVLNMTHGSGDIKLYPPFDIQYS